MIEYIHIPPALQELGPRIEGPIHIMRCFHSVAPKPGRGLQYKLSIAFGHWSGFKGSITLFDDHFWPSFEQIREALEKYTFEPSIAESLAQFAREYILTECERSSSPTDPPPARSTTPSSLAPPSPSSR